MLLRELSLFTLLLLAAPLAAQDCNRQCAPGTPRDANACCLEAPQAKSKPKAKPKPSQPASVASAAGTVPAPASSATHPPPVLNPPSAVLLLSPDADCEVFVDGVSAGMVNKNGLKRISATVEDHVVTAKNPAGKLFRTVVKIEKAGQVAVNIACAPEPPAAVAPNPEEENLDAYQLTPEDLRRIPILLDDATPVQGIDTLHMADRRNQVPSGIRHELGAALRNAGFEVTAVPARTPIKLKILAVPGMNGLHWTMARLELSVEYEGRLVDHLASTAVMEGSFGLLSFFNENATRYFKAAGADLASQMTRSKKLKQLIRRQTPH